MILGHTLVFVALILVVHLCAQTDLNCNHYESSPAGACTYVGAFGISLEYVCNGTDSMIQNIYATDDCSGTVGYSEAVDNTSLYQCDQMKPCDSVGVSVYNNSDCTDYIFGFESIIGVCISDNGTSYKSDCTDTELVAEYYFLSENCTGPSVTSETDTSVFLDEFGGSCVEVCVSK